MKRLNHKNRAKVISKLKGFPKVFYKSHPSGLKMVCNDIDYATGTHKLTKYNFR